LFFDRRAWGIDFSGGSLKAIHAERSGSSYKILDAVDLPYMKSADPIHAPRCGLPEDLPDVLGTFLAENRATLSDPVFVGIPAFGSQQGLVRLPAIGNDNLEQLLDLELHRTLRGEFEDWMIRHPPIDRRRRRLGIVGFYAHRKNVVHGLLAEIERIGLPVDGLVAEPIALQRWLEVQSLDPARTLVVHLLRSRTDLLYLTELGPKFRSLPIGAASLTGFLAGSRIPPRAEIERFARMIVAEHVKAARVFFGAAENSELRHWVMLGDGVTVKSLPEAIGERLALPLHACNAARNVDHALWERFHLDARTFVTALGLAHCGLKSELEPYSLVAPPAARRAMRRRPSLAVSMALIAAGLLFVHGQQIQTGRHLSRLEHELDFKERFFTGAELEKEKRDLESATLAASEYEKKMATLAHRRRSIRGLLDSFAKEGVPFRLVSTSRESGKEEDTVRLEVEVPRGLPAAEQQVADWVEKETRCKVAESHAQQEKDLLRVWITAADRQEPNEP